MKLKLCSIALAGTLLSGCGTQQIAKSPLGYDVCHFPDVPGTNAPSWICDQPVEGLEVQATGFARKMSGGAGLMKDVAASEARGQLAMSFSSDVKTKLDRLTTDKQVNGETQSSDAVERISSALAAMSMSDSRILRSQVSPSGGMYVLVGLTKGAYDANVRELFENAMDTETPGLYQQFLKEEGNSSLEQTRQRLTQ
ncbi:hypothetical protein HNR62_002871 [Oceanisphaera litoralis]|uniref:LPP20 family lipoprotein n=1 Tax=Oceanisphaera litoralis TaxID=225144 RepID=UPI00195CE23E|nr:LPP20 family lipoprotein [Oceanisphaera litoralis]MBM7456969.1 hypothetical protein [Oceanisphaera litoralis]